MLLPKLPGVCRSVRSRGSWIESEDLPWCRLVVSSDGAWSQSRFCPLQVRFWFTKDLGWKVLFDPFPELLGSSADIRALTVTRKVINDIALHSCRQSIFYNSGKGLPSGEKRSELYVTKWLMDSTLHFSAKTSAGSTFPRKGQSDGSWFGGFGLQLVGFRWFGGRSLFKFVDRFVSFMLDDSQGVAIVLEDKYAQSFMTQTQIVQISEWESVSAARRTLCCVQLTQFWTKGKFRTTTISWQALSIRLCPSHSHFLKKVVFFPLQDQIRSLHAQDTLKGGPRSCIFRSPMLLFVYCWTYTFGSGSMLTWRRGFHVPLFRESRPHVFIFWPKSPRQASKVVFSSLESCF